MKKSYVLNHLPNFLSISRIAATFLIFLLILTNTSGSFLSAFTLFALASITDFFDGYLARKMKVVSSFGVFLDLTADKILVAATLIGLLQLNLVSAWIVLIIISREILVSGLRSIAAVKGKVIPAGKLGKQKTLITLIALSCLLLARGLEVKSLFLIANILLLLATIWTMLSAIQYSINALKLSQTRQ